MPLEDIIGVPAIHGNRMAFKVKKVGQLLNQDDPTMWNKVLKRIAVISWECIDY